MASDLSKTTAVEKYSYKKSLRQRRKNLQLQKSGEHEGEDDITDAGLAELTGGTGDPDAAPEHDDPRGAYGEKKPVKERRKTDRRKAKPLTKKEQTDFND